MGEHYLKDELYELIRSDPTIFDFLQAGSLDGVWYWDLKAPDVEWMSERFWTTFGFDPGQRRHLAEEWQDLIHPDDLQRALANFHAHAADPDHPYDQIVRYRHADGSTVWVRCRGLIIRDDEGRPHRMLGAHTEVTELKQTEADLRRTAAELKRSNEDLDRFAAIASHDLQAPLRSIRGFAELLADEADDLSPECAEYLEHIRSSAADMQGLIDGLLALSRVGNQAIARRPVDLDAVAEVVVARLGDLVAEAGGEVALEPLPSVLGDATLLTRVLQNLLDNALKFRDPERPPRIRVRGRREGDAVIIDVEDNGRGIDPKFHERIFEMFRRVRDRGDAPTEGVGIGLPTARRIAGLHGGTLTVASVRGEGTTFSLRLPGAPS